MLAGNGAGRSKSPPTQDMGSILVVVSQKDMGGTGFDSRLTMNTNDRNGRMVGPGTNLTRLTATDWLISDQIPHFLKLTYVSEYLELRAQISQGFGTRPRASFLLLLESPADYKYHQVHVYKRK